MKVSIIVMVVVAAGRSCSPSANALNTSAPVLTPESKMHVFPRCLHIAAILGSACSAPTAPSTCLPP